MSGGWVRGPRSADERSPVDADHAMLPTLFSAVSLLLMVAGADGKLGDLKLCVVGNPGVKSTRATKYCDLLGKSKRSPVSCVFAADRLECLSAVSSRKADFSVFEAEDLYFSTLWEGSSVLVVSEIRALKKKAFQYGLVAMVRTDGNVTGIGGLRGKRLCHPGLDTGPEWNDLFAQYFEERVAPANCEEDLSIYEDRIKTTSDFFGSACKAGPWSLDAEEDARLKSKYRNLCAICEGGDCSNRDKYRGSGGSITCFKDGVGDVLWARLEDVKTHLKFLESGSAEASDYSFLCDDGTLVPLATEEPCFWLAKPWRVIGANRKSATDVQKLVDGLGDDVRNDWKENFLHVVELYLEYVQNLIVSRTPEDYLRRIPGYLSASAMSQGNCKPRHSVGLCVTSAVEEEKCDWISKAASALGIQPSLECRQMPNVTACLDSVARTETDVAVVAPDFLDVAITKFKLNYFLVEIGSRLNASYLASVVVKKKSGTKRLSDLRGLKACLSRRRGAAWWALHSALGQDSLSDSPCDAPSEFFGEVCFMDEGCCPGEDEGDLLRCLRDDACDAVVLDFHRLLENSEKSRSDLRTICRSDRAGECHWMWSYPHYLMTHADMRSPKGMEVFGVFRQLSQFFGKSSRKKNLMMQIFGPFHEARDVLFRDSSSSFAGWNQRNRSNSLLDAEGRMRLCSASPVQLSSTEALILIALSIAFLTDGTNHSPLTRLIRTVGLTGSPLMEKSFTQRC